MTCEFCKIIKGETKAEKIYEDAKFIAVLNPAPAALGHVLVIPKFHYQIVEQLPDYEAADLFKTANKISTAVFEALQPKGTNVIIQNGVAAGQGVPHVCIHIIPRNDNDGIDLQWQPKQLTEEEMSTVELTLKKGAESIGAFETEEKKEPIKMRKKQKHSSSQKKERII